MKSYDEKKLRYAAIGDSITVGVGSASIKRRGFVPRYKEFSEIALGTAIKDYNFGKSGDTSRQILKRVLKKEVFKTVCSSDIITITAGGNDLIQAARTYFKTYEEDALFQALHNCKKNMTKLLCAITEEKDRKGKPYCIRICNLYNPYSRVESAVKWVNLFNEHLEGFCRFPNVKTADLYSAFLGREKELLWWDSIHPNSYGYQAIAVSLYELGYGELIDS
ncbi:GDSL-type esterase/lipase family protein [Fictibacillus iocasae]|uniref:GDSL-type esterase/lipase family protein n=1 Tax=Fictibacillus iocasae TaxID=2715437 RepID=A0ABW2NMF1_9BACL